MGAPGTSSRWGSGRRRQAPAFARAGFAVVGAISIADRRWWGRVTTPLWRGGAATLPGGDRRTPVRHSRVVTLQAVTYGLVGRAATLPPFSNSHGVTDSLGTHGCTRTA